MSDGDKEFDLKDRTKAFAVRVLTLVDALPRTSAGRTVANQMARSGASVGANCRAACRGQSTREIIAKLGIAEEACDETAFWIEVATEANLVEATQCAELLVEADELTAIIVSSIKTARKSL